MSYEFDCKCKGEEKKVYLSDLSMYNGITYEYDTYFTDKRHVLKLYYFKRYSDCDGFVSCDREYDSFCFADKSSCLKVYEDIKKLLKGKK